MSAVRRPEDARAPPVPASGWGSGSYWAVGQLFEQIGNINLLPAALAAWSPDAVFALAGIYLMTRMRT